MLSGWKSIVGSLVALAASVATASGVDIGDQDMLVNGILAIGGAIFAIYGRVVAKKNLTGGNQK